MPGILMSSAILMVRSLISVIRCQSRREESINRRYKYAAAYCVIIATRGAVHKSRGVQIVSGVESNGQRLRNSREELLSNN